MSRKVKVFIAVGLILVITPIVAVYLLWNSMVTALVQQSLKGAKANGLNIGWKGIDVVGTTVTLRTIDGWLAIPTTPDGKGLRIPLKVDLEDVRFAVPIWASLTGDPTLTGSMRGYGGELRATITSARSNPTLSAQLQNFDIGLHPQVQALGIRSAVITGNLEGLTTSPKPKTPIQFSLNVSNIEIPLLPTKLTIIQVPPIQNGTIIAEGVAEAGAINIKKFSSSSSLGQADGWLKVFLPTDGGRSTCEGETTVSLSDSGSKFFGPWLPLAAGPAFNAQVRNFKVRITGVQCDGRAQSQSELKIGKLCVRSNFETIGAVPPAQPPQRAQQPPQPTQELAQEPAPAEEPATELP